ncbi:MAG: hypothetical protein Q8N18_09505 [Opitutaceae bacterium]|nr:hypothetical protein [Opitutaceae bacterium]
MSLTPEQKAAVSTWVAAGDNLSAVQKKIIEQFKVSMTYRDVRFLVDDLNLELKDPAPKVDTSDVSKTPPPVAKPAAEKPAAKKSPLEKAENLPAAAADAEAELADDPDALPPEDELEELPVGDSTVTVTVDKVTLIPGALAAGTVTFSDGVTGKWVIDQQYRPGFTEISQPGYRPSPADAQAFMQELSAQLQKRGF